MLNLVEDMIEVREKVLFLLSQAEEAISIIEGKEIKIVLPNAYHPQMSRAGDYVIKICAIGRRQTERKYRFFGSRDTETLFYYRRDWFKDEIIPQNYTHSELKEKTKKQVIEELDKGGEWGQFLKINENLLELIHAACVGGNERPEASPIKFLPQKTN